MREIDACCEVSAAYDMFKRSSGQIENQLDKLTKMASLYLARHYMLMLCLRLDDDGVEYLNVTVTDEPSLRQLMSF